MRKIPTVRIQEKCVCMYYFLWAIILVSLALDADTDVVEDDQKYVKDNVNGVVYDSINASTHQQFVASKLHNQRTKRNAYGSSSRKDDDDSYRSNEVWKQLWPMDIEYRSNLVGEILFVIFTVYLSCNDYYGLTDRRKLINKCKLDIIFANISRVDPFWINSFLKRR